MAANFEENSEQLDLVRRYESCKRGVVFHFFDVFDYVDIIEYYLSKLEKDKAEEAVEMGLEQHPDATAILYKKVEVLVLDNKPKKAQKLLEELAIENNDSEFFLLQGTVFTSLRKFEEANRAYEKAVANENDKELRYDLLFRIGLAFQHVFEFRLALHYHYQLYEEKPDELANLFELSYCYEQLEAFENSIRFYNKYLDISPYSYKVWYNLGIIYNRLQRYEEAVEAYDYTLAIAPKHSKAFFNKGNALFYLKRYEEALNCYFSYLDYEDDHSFTHTYIGECYEKLGQYGKAFAHYNKALEIDSELADAWFGLGMVAKLQEMLNDAIFYMEKAAKADPTYAECYAELGELYEQKGEETLAVNAYRYAIVAEPEVLQYHLELAKYYHRQGNLKAARQMLEAVQKDFRNEAELFYYLSLFTFLLDDKLSAKKYLQKAKDIDNEQFDAIVEYCESNEKLVSKIQIDELSKL